MTGYIAGIGSLYRCNQGMLLEGGRKWEKVFIYFLLNRIQGKV